MIPIHRDDRLTWNKSHKGLFMVKSAYKVIQPHKIDLNSIPN